MKARVLERRGLSTEREVLHVALAVDFATMPGDTVGVLAPQRCDALLDWLGMPELRDELTWKLAIDRPTQKLVKAVGAYAQPGDDVLAYLSRAGAKVDPRPYLAPHLRRAFSIASSSKRHPGEVHLCVAVLPNGVASTFLRDLDPSRDDVDIVYMPSRSFRIGDDLDVDAILIGPGTGIAPFRALLEERAATNARGRTWLFTGGRTSGDVLYGDELNRSLAVGRLDVALSRVGPEKIYVQHLLVQHGAEVWEWIERGAHVYVCGDGKRMAKDVHESLVTIVATHGGRSVDDARRFVVESLGKTERRYRRDVW